MKILGLLIAMLLVCGVVFAETTSRGNYTTPVPPLTNWLNNNDCIYHDHDYELCPDRYSEFEKKRGNPLGIGLDLTVYEFDGMLNKYGLDTVEVQNKWDMKNNDYSGYIVIQTNPYRVIRDLLK